MTFPTSALKREKDSLKVQHDKLLDELVKMRSESAALRDRISTDKVFLSTVHDHNTEVLHYHRILIVF